MRRQTWFLPPGGSHLAGERWVLILGSKGIIKPTSTSGSSPLDRTLCLCPWPLPGPHSCLGVPAPPPRPHTCWVPQGTKPHARAIGRSKMWPFPLWDTLASLHWHAHPTPQAQPQVTSSWTPTWPAGAERALSSIAAVPSGGRVSGRLPAEIQGFGPGAVSGPEPPSPGPGLWPLQQLS